MNKQSVFLVFMILTLGGLTHCGFSPVYGKKSFGGDAVPSVLRTIKVADIPDRSGQFLRNELIDRFYLDGTPVDPAYVLEVSPVSERRSDLDITVSSDTTRSRLTLTATIKLIDTRTGSTVLSKSVKSISSYNVLGDQYATRTSEINTRENGLRELARQIEQQISLHFGLQN